MSEADRKYTALANEFDSFVHSVSHDLRAPLRAFTGYLEMFERNYADRLDDEGRRRLSVLEGEARRMEALLEGLLEVSRLARRPMKLLPVDMTALAREVSERERLRSDSRNAVVGISALPEVRGDRGLLQHVWEHLISNALKFSSKVDAPAISIAGEIVGDEAVYSVKDNGAGFDLKYADKLFGMFQRFHKAGEYPGIGVGLAIAQRIVARHEGRVWADAHVAEGATFWFALPLAFHEP